MIDYNKRKIINLTIKIPLELWGEHEGITSESIEKDLNHQFSYWNDGRYSYLVEQMKDSLTRMVKESIRESIHSHFQEMYPREIVPYENGSTARFIVESDKLGEVVTPAIGEEIEVNIKGE